MSYIIWIVVGAIVVIMAIIGYVAENKGKNEKVKKERIPEVNVQEIEAKEGAATWSKDAKPKDEKQEIEHKVASVDDWSKIPTTEDKLPEVKLDALKDEPKEEEKEESKQENEEVMFADIDTNRSNIKELSEVLAVPEPMPADVSAPEAVTMPAPTEPVMASNLDTSVSSEPSLESGPAVQTASSLNTEAKTEVSDLVPEATVISNEVEPISTPEQITEPVNTENIWS